MDTLQRLPADHELLECLAKEGDQIVLIGRGIRALPLLVDELCRGHSLGFRALLQDRVLQGCTKRGVPLPQVGAGVEEIGEINGGGLGMGEEGGRI